MEKAVNIGDLVESTAGRDKGEIFLVIKVENEFVFVVDGRTRKVTCPKKKKFKHIKSVCVEVLKALATEIQSGRPVGNDRLKKAIATAKQKIQED